MTTSEDRERIIQMIQGPPEDDLQPLIEAVRKGICQCCFKNEAMPSVVYIQQLTRAWMRWIPGTACQECRSKYVSSVLNLDEYKRMGQPR